ncbi:MAG: hypothetical protein JJ895_09275 [Balneolaceae bacterium]|nr:hypothetical protein [Balneolaceae bacterium]
MKSPSGQPSIELFDITIMEPVVTLTDFLITAVCLFAYLKLRKKNLAGKVHQYMRWYFLIMAIATFLGGLLGHAFQAQVGLAWKLPGWLISMLAVSSIERATIMYAFPLLKRRFARFLEIANVVELLVFAVITFSTLNFFYIQVHSAYGLGLIVLPIHFYIFMQTQNPGSKLICRATLFATLAAFFYTSEIGISVWFNHLDLAHTVMAISLYFFYKATLILPVYDQSTETNPVSFSKGVQLLFKGN